MRVLITGASGFIGSQVARMLMDKLTADDDDIVLTDWMPRFYELSGNASFDDGVSITNKSDLERLPFPFDVVIHCAAVLGTELLFNDIIGAERVNVIGTLNLLSLLGSGFMIQPTVCGRWLSPYQISKNTAEAYGLMYREYLGALYTSVHLTSVYGPGQSTEQNKATPTFIKAALEDKPIQIQGDGSYKLRLIYIDDVAKAFVRLALLRYSSEPIIHLTSSNLISVFEYANLIIDLVGSQSEIEFAPFRKGQPPDALWEESDLAQAGRMMDLLEITETPLIDGLKKTIEYYSAGKSCGSGSEAPRMAGDARCLRSPAPLGVI